MLRTNSKTKKTRTKKVARLSRFSGLNVRLPLFIATFALVGVFLLFQSFAGTQNTNQEVYLANLVNQHRGSHSLNSLARAKCLTMAAREWAQYLGDSGQFRHSDTVGLVNKYGCSNWRGIAENIGRGGTVDSQHAAYLNSQCHHFNIDSVAYKSNPDGTCTATGGIGSAPYTFIGTATYTNDGGVLITVEIFGHCTTNCGGEWTAPIPENYPGPAQVTITGRTTFAGGPAWDVLIETCTGQQVRSDGNGNFRFNVNSGAGFCVRASGQPGVWGTPTTNNNGDVGGANVPSYEYQIAGKNCYHACGGGANTWDRNTDGSYDFNWAEHRSIGLTSSGKGYEIDAFGGIRSIGGTPTINPSHWWPNWQIARAVLVDPSGNNQAYVLDGWGGLHGLNGAPQLSGSAYWGGWDIARDVKMLNWSAHSGYTLSGWGSLHAFGGAPSPKITGYWQGQDQVAKKFVINGAGTGGYVLDWYGGLHPFNLGTNNGQPYTRGGPYWSGWNIARSVVLNPNNTGGYVMDGWGGLHPFAVGNNPIPPKIQNFPYWSGWDVARDVVITNWSGAYPTGYTLSAWGSVHRFGP